MGFSYVVSKFLLFQNTACLSWVKEKSEASTQKLTEAILVHNLLSEKYNELKSSVDLKESENARLKKKLKEVEVAFSAREAELKKVESKAEYYEDKSMSIELFTTVKSVRRCLRSILRAQSPLGIPRRLS